MVERQGGAAETMELWTAQQRVVLDALERDGVSYVKSAYIDQKYTDTAWIFRTAYREFGRIRERQVIRPAGRTCAQDMRTRTSAGE